MLGLAELVEERPLEAAGEVQIFPEEEGRTYPASLGRKDPDIIKVSFTFTTVIKYCCSTGYIL